MNNKTGKEETTVKGTAPAEGFDVRRAVATGGWVLVRHLRRPRKAARDGLIYVPAMPGEGERGFGEADVRGTLPLGEVLSVGPKVEGRLAGLVGRYVVVDESAGVGGGRDARGCVWAFYAAGGVLGEVER